MKSVSLCGGTIAKRIKTR
ncbi:hypothetical protein VCHENC02_5438B, partial [Vibrio harveyi]